MRHPKTGAVRKPHLPGGKCLFIFTIHYKYGMFAEYLRQELKTPSIKMDLA